VPAGERGERGGQRGRTTDGTGTNDRRAKRATRRHRTRRRRRPMRPTSRPRRRTQARLERSGKPRPRGTVAHEYAPSRNPFLKRRGRVLRYLMRPVPVVRRPMAFVDQLSVSAAEGGESQSPGFPHLRAAGSRRIRGFVRPEGGVGIATRTVPLAGRGVAARAARGLLDVEGATTTPAMSRGRRPRSRQSIASKTLSNLVFSRSFSRLTATATAGGVWRRTACTACGSCSSSCRSSRYLCRSYPWFVCGATRKGRRRSGATAFRRMAASRTPACGMTIRTRGSAT